MYQYILSIVFITALSLNCLAQSYSVRGKIISSQTKQPLEFATLTIAQTGAWSLSDKNGNFELKDIKSGTYKIEARILGYVSQIKEITINYNVKDLIFELNENSLQLKEVVVTSKLDKNAVSSYKVDRIALDHSNILNVSDITALLPGGKFRGDLNLASSDKRFSLRSNTSENGNPTFGTAVEVDGIRLNNNAAFNEIAGTDTRNISLVNIESVEIISGVPSAEYGDLSNGVIKINTKRGKTPLFIEAALRPHTKQFAISKGVQFGHKGGIMNFSAEHTKSISDLASPFTSYDRNALSINYFNDFNFFNGKSLRFDAGISGNLGGYNSKADPDEFVDTYTKVKDNNFRANFNMKFLFNLDWLTTLNISGSINYSDKIKETNTNKSSSSSISAIHSKEEGYFIAQDYNTNPNADIVLIEPGYWYQLSYYDNKPVYYNFKIKGDWIRNFNDNIYNKLLLGLDFNRSGNLGRGEFYDDMKYAPTWRDYDLSSQPFMNDIAL